MGSSRRHKLVARTAVFAGLWLTALDSNASADVAIIAHPSVGVGELSRTELIDLFTGDIRLWQNGDIVVVFDLKEKNETRQTFYDYIGKSASRVKSIWMKRMLSGEGDPPESLGNETDILSRVAETPGAIGFVNSSLVDNRVKKLLVIPDSAQSKD